MRGYWISKMALASIDQSQYLYLKQGYNKITFQGCASLSAPRWFKLQHLNISDNAIGDAGVQHLCKGPWAILQHVDLSNILDIQVKIILRVNRASILLKLTGGKFIFFVFVSLNFIQNQIVSETRDYSFYQKMFGHIYISLTYVITCKYFRRKSCRI